MKFGILRNTAVAATALIVGLGVSSATFAAKPVYNLPVQDDYTTTLVDKSVVAGTIRSCGTTVGAACYGPFELDSAGNLLFDYTGTVNSIDTNETTGELETIKEPIGTIAGTAAFPMSFGAMAMDMRAVLDGDKDPSTVVIPAVIPWTCNHCEMVVDGKSYTSIVDDPLWFDANGVEDLRMKGRAFTGIGPVEVGQIVPGNSLSVRMAGCSAVTGDGKVGTLCLNGTFTFDMTNLNFGQLTGTGTSNCVTVLQPLPSM